MSKWSKLPTSEIVFGLREGWYNEDFLSAVADRIAELEALNRNLHESLEGANLDVEGLQAQVDLLEMTKDAWRCNEDQTANQCIWDVQAILDGYTPQALQEKPGST